MPHWPPSALSIFSLRAKRAGRRRRKSTAGERFGRIFSNRLSAARFRRTPHGLPHDHPPHALLARRWSARARQGRRAPRRAWVQLSSVRVYGPVREGVVDESRPYAPRGEYETTKAESDRLVLEAFERGAFSCTILRPSIDFGP